MIISVKIDWIPFNIKSQPTEEGQYIVNFKSPTDEWYDVVWWNGNEFLFLREKEYLYITHFAKPVKPII